MCGSPECTLIARACVAPDVGADTTHASSSTNTVSPPRTHRTDTRRKSATGGSGRWRSGAADRGSIRGYSKDVRERKVKPERRGAGGSRGGGSAGASEGKRAGPAVGRPGSARRGLKHQDAAKWTVPDVLRWLSTIGLEQYGPAFTENEINGAVLLELTTDDLAYLKINILGHRKMLLKAVEKLQVAAGVAPASMAASPAATVSGSVSAAPPAPPNDPTSAAAGEARTPPGKGETKIVHWSHVAPLAENEVVGGEPPVNLADGTFDEAAAHASFREAVMQWRTGDGSAGAAPVTIEREGEMWHNPFMGSGAATSASGTGTGTGSGAGIGSGGRATVGSSLLTHLEEAAPGGGGKLLSGALDEDAEHREFQRAVDAWRSGKGPVSATDAAGSATDAAAGAAARGAEKHSCYQCYKLYYSAAGEGSGSGVVLDEHTFCSAGCSSTYSEAKEGARRAAAESAAKAEASAKELQSAREAAKASAGASPSVVRDADGDEFPAPADNSPRRDYSNIWDLDVGY